MKLALGTGGWQSRSDVFKELLSLHFLVRLYLIHSWEPGAQTLSEFSLSFGVGQSTVAPKPIHPTEATSAKRFSLQSFRRKVERRTLIGSLWPNDCGQKDDSLLIGQALQVEVSPTEGLGMGFWLRKGEWSVICHRKGC